jgi:hypothetical protein
MQSLACTPRATCAHSVVPGFASPLSDAPAPKQDSQSPANTRRSTCDQRPASRAGLPRARGQRLYPARRAAPSCNASQNTLECQSRLACRLAGNRRGRTASPKLPWPDPPRLTEPPGLPPLRRAADRRRSAAAGGRSSPVRVARILLHLPFGRPFQRAVHAALCTGGRPMRLLLQAPGANPPHARMHAGPMRRTMTHIAAPPITPRRPARKANARQLSCPARPLEHRDGPTAAAPTAAPSPARHPHPQRTTHSAYLAPQNSTPPHRVCYKQLKAAGVPQPPGARAQRQPGERPPHHRPSAMMVLVAQLACSMSAESPDARACAACARARHQVFRAVGQRRAGDPGDPAALGASALVSAVRSICACQSTFGAHRPDQKAHTRHCAGMCRAATPPHAGRGPGQQPQRASPQPASLQVHLYIYKRHL